MNSIKKLVLPISIVCNIIFIVLFILYFSTGFFSFSAVSIHLPRVCDEYITWSEADQEEGFDKLCGIEREEQ